MSQATIDAIILLVHGRIKGGLRKLDISWFGGEPLLAAEIVQEISARILELTTGKSPFEYSAGMTTNALLLDMEAFEHLVSLGITKYQITLDGAKDRHDSLRIQGNGLGTFDRIWSNLVAMKACPSDFAILLRVHFEQDAVFEARQIVELINDEFGDDDRFKVNFHAIEPLGERQRYAPKTSESQKRLIWEELAKQLKTSKMLYSVRPGDAYVCYASEPNAMVVRSGGQICKCTVGLEDDRNHVGDLKSDGTISWNAERLAPWFEGLETGNMATLSCPYHAIKTSGDARLTQLVQINHVR